MTQCDAPIVSFGNDQDMIATGLDPCTPATTGCALDSAMYVTLPPGAYTAIVSGVGGRTGVGLVGVFEVPPCGSGSAGERFVLFNGGTPVCDNTTGLIWEQSLDSNLRTFQQATDYCSA